MKISNPSHSLPHCTFPPKITTIVSLHCFHLKSYAYTMYLYKIAHTFLFYLHRRFHKLLCTLLFFFNTPWRSFHINTFRYRCPLQILAALLTQCSQYSMNKKFQQTNQSTRQVCKEAANHLKY